MAGDKACKLRDTTLLWNIAKSSIYHQKLKSNVSMLPQKGLMSLKKRFDLF